ncbi:MAG: CHAT domain-containing protein [Bacteroidota bacterium]
MYYNYLAFLIRIAAPSLLVIFSSLIFVSCKTPSIVATQAIQQGDMANNQHDYETAIYNYETYLEVAPSLGVMRNTTMEADVNRKLAHAYSTQGKYNKSLQVLEDALRIDSAEPDNLLNIIDDHRQIGLTHVYMGQYPEAMESLSKALDLNAGMETSLKAVKKLSIADTYLSKAQLELTMGLFNDCFKDAQLAQGIYDKEDKEGVGMIEVNLLLAKLYLARNSLDSANWFIKQSVKLSENNDYSVFRQLQVQGDIELQRGNPENAVLIKQKALDEAVDVNIIPQIIWSHIRLGDVYEVIGDSKKAKEQYKKAKKLQGSIGRESSSLNPSINQRLGDVKNAYDFYNQNGAMLGANIAVLKMAEAELFSQPTDSLEVKLLSAYDYFHAEKIIEGIAKTDLLLSKLYREQERFDKASVKLEEAESYNTSPDTRWKINYNKGLLSEAKGDFKEAENWYEQSIEIFEKQRNDITRNELKWHYLNAKVDVYDSYLTMILKYESVDKKTIEKAFNLSEKARSRTFLEMLNNRSFVDNQKNELVKREQHLNSEINFINSQILQAELKKLDTEYYKEKLEKLTLEYNDIISELNQKNDKYISLISIEPVSLTNLTNALDKETALLKFWVGKDELVTWKITKNDITSKILDIDKNEVNKGVTKVRNLIRFGIEDKIVDGFTELNQLLAPSFQNVFEEYKQVGIIPHGPLHFVPYEALNNGETFLVEKVDIFYAPSASIYYHSFNRSKTTKGNRFFGMALGELQIGEYHPLPGTAMELQQLTQFYDDNRCLYEDDVSETYFKEHAGDYDLIHVATHGVMNKYNPSKSYILMAPSDNDNGQLSVEEIFDIDLSSKLVTLSACETGLGDLSKGDELIGLSRAFMYAGSSAVVVSLWKVDDVSTSLLMTKMHQYVDAGMSLASALAQAQRDLIDHDFNPSAGGSRGMRSVEWHNNLQNVVNSKEKKFTSPYFWAPFIIIGSN